MSTFATLSDRIACSRRFLGEGKGEHTKELEEIRTAVQREQRRKRRRRGREGEGWTADQAIVINSDDSESEPSPKRAKAEESAGQQQVDSGGQQQAGGSGRQGEGEMDSVPLWKPVSATG